MDKCRETFEEWAQIKSLLTRIGDDYAGAYGGFWEVWKATWQARQVEVDALKAELKQIREDLAQAY